MKRIMCLTGAALLLTVTGCSKIHDFANINVDIPYNQQITVPQVAGDAAGVPLPAGGANLPFPAFPVMTNAQQYVSTYKTSIDKIISFDLNSMVIQIQSPPNQNFDFLDSIQLYISANSQLEMLVAYANSVPKGQTTLSLTAMPGVNLKNYFIQDTMYYRLNAHINAVPASGTVLNIASSFHLLANPLE